MTEESTHARYLRLATVFDGTVEGLENDAWDKPSPCEKWSARDVLEHVISSEADFVTKVGLSIARSVDIKNDPVGAWRELRDGMQAILDDPSRAELTFESLGKETTLAASADQFLCVDLILHRWDIARAAGENIEIAEEDIAASNAFLDSMGSMFYDYGASAPALAVADDASPQDKLLARAGRQPQWVAR